MQIMINQIPPISIVPKPRRPRTGLQSGVILQQVRDTPNEKFQHCCKLSHRLNVAAASGLNEYVHIDGGMDRWHLNGPTTLFDSISYMEAPINDFNGPGLYLFQVQHSKKYLDLDESKKANHTKVQQWEARKHHEDQNWVVAAAGHDEYLILADKAGTCLTAPGTITLYLYHVKEVKLLRKTENQLLEISSQQLISISGGSLSARKMELTSFIVWLILIRFLTSKVLATKMVLLC
ncbi:hypothetical protein BDV35DRAFT_407813 [Aspergillus flavus]|uniref:Ricin B lectin domain-containing protein n=1 Tax=Aspergillus flavus TaxID=5059 RepID=A0A5N6GL91_ASPFL|nr:hypothetical protein BDV35DRAFT_407813 [Aspergillus flavus]